MSTMDALDIKYDQPNHTVRDKYGITHVFESYKNLTLQRIRSDILTITIKEGNKCLPIDLSSEDEKHLINLLNI